MSISVVIPVRNRPAAVLRALASVQAQTSPVDQILVIDDASTDETPAQVQRAAQHDPRIELVSLKTKGGAGNARNVGVARSRGDWIAFLDSDDEWRPRKLERQLAALRDAPGAIASFTGIRYVTEDGDTKDEALDEQLPSPHLRRLNFLGSTSSALVRRSDLVRAGGFDPSLPSCQDWDLWLRLTELGTFALVAEPLLIYAKSQVGRISSNASQVLAGHEVVFARALAGVSDRRERRAIESYHLARLAQVHLWDLDRPKEAQRLALKALRHRPSRLALQLWIASTITAAKAFQRAKRTLRPAKQALKNS